MLSSTKSRIAGKRLIQTLFFVLLVTQICFAQWYQQNSGTSEKLNSVHFEDANNGWAVGDSGTILHTTNGGQEWVTQVSGTIFNLNDVVSSGVNNGWVVGGNGTILGTLDGGLNWIEQISGITTNLFSVYFTDQNFGWAVGQGDTILKTTNGGTSWTPHSLNNQSDFSDVYFIDQNNGWINQNSVDISNSFKTTDRGENWTLSIMADMCDSFNSIDFIDANNGHIVGPSGSKDVCPPWGGCILNTSDGGSNWTYQYLMGTVLVDVYFTDVLNGWAVGYTPGYLFGLILKSTDAGVSWIEQTIDTTSPLWCVRFTDINTGWTVGDNGIILHTTNGGVSFIEEEQIDKIPTEFLLSLNYPNPFNPSTKIKYSVPNQTKVIIKVYDVLGNEIETLVNEENPTGTYEITWHSADLPSGVYFYQLKAGSFVSTKKMLLLK